MENNIESMEFEEMRQQMAALRAQLDEQLQLNEDRLQKSILRQTDSIHSYGSYTLIAGIIISITAPALLDIMYDFSLACCITTSVFVLFDACYEYWSAYRIKSKDLSTKNLSEIINTLVSMKKMNAKWFTVSFILGFPLLYWYGYEFFSSHFYEIVKHSDNFEFFCYFSICTIIVGTIFGVWFSVHLYKKQKHNIEDLLNMINNNK